MSNGLPHIFEHFQKGLNGEGMKFGGPFFRKVSFFHEKVSFLANIEHCPKFLEYTSKSDRSKILKENTGLHPPAGGRNGPQKAPFGKKL